jgi:RimJ/RimL family protein N-acetyltransferase
MADIVLITERLMLRTWQASDVPLLAAISIDPVVMEYFPSVQDLAATEKLIKHCDQQQEDYGYSLYAVQTKDTHEFIGFVGLNQPSFVIPNFTPMGLPIVEIGWRLAASQWGKGYATEAAIAVLHYAFTVLTLDEIISFTVVGNSKSRRVMQKIGLQYMPSNSFDHPKLEVHSPLRRHVLYRLTRAEYNARQA